MRTRRFSAGRISRRNSRRARASGGRGSATVVFGKNGFWLVAFLSLDEAEFLQVAGKSGLRDAHLLLGEAAAEVLLIGDGLPADKPQDLTVTKCFTGAHDSHKYTALLHFYTIIIE